MISVDERRIRELNSVPISETGAVVYWMQRDQRAQDNWALLYAYQCAVSRQVPLYVVFTLQEIIGRSHARHYDFMLKGLKQTEQILADLHIPFYLLRGEPVTVLNELILKKNIGHIITDFSPMKYARMRRESVAESVNVRLSEVDAHNIVPVWETSPKLEFAAYTIRPKIHRKLNEFLTDFPKISPLLHVSQDEHFPTFDVSEAYESLAIDVKVQPVDWLDSGTVAGYSLLDAFIANRLPEYAEKRNNPNESVLSNLSPYVHFGQISAQKVALEVKRVTGVSGQSKESFLDEIIVRRELSDNYCFYNEKYDRVEGAHAWAQQTISEHAKDQRPYLYSRDEFENTRTHDELWNAMQTQMVTEGKMHGWCRMYWAKKILEWTPDVQTAIDIALYLNDKYELDGNDPNGVVGVMWSICGVHDRAWNERPVFGKVRYMNFNGAKRKFDVDAYIARYTPTSRLFDE